MKKLDSFGVIAFLKEDTGSRMDYIRDPGSKSRQLKFFENVQVIVHIQEHSLGELLLWR